MFLSLLLSVMTVVSAQGDVCTKKLDEANVQLCGKEDGEWLRNLTLHVGKETYTFPEWEHVNDPKALPQLYSVDVTEDGKEDIVVFLVKSRGNGTYKNEVHVLSHQRNGIEEVLVEDPRPIILKSVKMNETDEGTELIIDHVHALIPHNREGGKGIKTTFNRFLKYAVDKQKLKAVLLLERKRGEYIGSLIVSYEYKDGLFQATHIDFIRH
ncbi:hypothetical protein [Anoxybacillus sp. ST4]|uniref:hypothetical protein n=1 Tax=Anoxybacillus sp. ST4 TaxID=2864181 RepID=UPI001C64482D|nr:hypothetical protein [Anoxybacillus sp. ST4]MBW7650538.1 hypothetical protein [Anoxybacillus sp. ST4]